MDLFRRFFGWLRSDSNINEPDRAITNRTVQTSNESAANSNSTLPPLAERDLQMTILVDAFRAIVRAERIALETRIAQGNDRVISELRTEIQNMRQEMRNSASYQSRDQVFAISTNYVPQEQETTPANFIQEVQQQEAQQNGNESSPAFSQEVPRQQNQNQAMNVPNREGIGQSAQSPSQEVSRMPAQQNTIRINNNFTVAHCYKMDHKNRGLCLIFSHMLFKNKSLSQRTCAPKEATMIENTFERKGFRVIKCEDFTFDKIKRKLRILKSLINDDDDCTCICISTHGLEGILWAYDAAYSIDIFEDTLVKIKKLIGKPKLMFIQACRGTKVDRGVPLHQASSVSEDQSDNAVNSMRHPTRADCLIVYSTPYGYVSWRNWFFEALCKNLNMYGHKDDIDEILRKTARKICENESRCNGDRTKDRAKQVPAVYSTLTKRLFLKRN